MSIEPTVVVSAYNRPKALARLLGSLQKAYYPPGCPVRLVVSIDRAEDHSHCGVLELAEGFQWAFGEKQVILQEEHLGLVEHFYRCGDLSQIYGSIILLEDDLFASQVYYLYAAQALEFFQADPRIAGISLYALWFNGYTHFPFNPLSDGSDIYFLQIPNTQGQAMTGSQWAAYRSWLERSDLKVRPEDPVHETYLRFKEDEWLPLRTKYLVETGRYFIYPRDSLTTGFGDMGAHFNKTSVFFQVPLQTSRREFRFNALDESNAVYDSYFEILPDRLNNLNPSLEGLAYDVDLNGTKSPAKLQNDLVLTSQSYSRRSGAPLRAFGRVMWPVEANIIYEVPGDELVLCRSEDLQTGWLPSLAAKKRSFDYFNRHHPIGKKLLLQFTLIEWLNKIGFRF